MPLLGDFEGRVGIYRFLQSPKIPRMLPSLFICRDVFSFCPFNRVHAHLQAQGLSQGILTAGAVRYYISKYNILQKMAINVTSFSNVLLVFYTVKSVKLILIQR